MNSILLIGAIVLFVIGKATINSVPTVRSLLTIIHPLCNKTMFLAMANPIPDPK